MARWENVHVEPDFAGATRSERQGGTYRRYHPDRMAKAAEVLDSDTLEYAHETSRLVAVLGERLRARPLPMLYATLIRSESIASSWVEGERETPRNIMVAMLDHERATHQGRTVARNIVAMRAAIQRLDGAWQHDDVHAIHQALLPTQPPGYRDRAVWIGGRTPLTADYAAPPHTEVRPYMDDLVDYANLTADSPLLAALLTHAQFETVHPFRDGNGRVGRALFHGTLHRGGLVTEGVLPLSLALKTDTEGYVASLMKTRYDGTDPEVRRVAMSGYVHRMCDFVQQSVAVAARVGDEVERITDRWAQALARYRSDSSVHAASRLVIEQPVVTAGHLEEQLGVSKVAANNAIKALVDTEILAPATGKLKRSNLFQANEVLDVLDLEAAFEA